MYSFGHNTYGQLGITGANAYKEARPTKLSLSRLIQPLSFSTGEEHCALVSQNSNIWTWGYGNDGQLGHDNKNSLNTGKQIKGAKDVVSAT